MNRLSPMVAMTSGSTPASRSRATRSLRTRKPRRNVERRTVASRAAAKGSRKTIQNSTIANAGNTTNSPCAKLMVFEVCHRSTKPIATIA